MSKTRAIHAILEAAVNGFAQNGFEGTSLRDIAAEANTPLSAIDRYFGSKEELFRAALRQVWLEVERDRDLLLSRAFQHNGLSPPSLNDLLYALARPIVERALSKQEGDVARTILLRNIGLVRQDGKETQLSGVAITIRSLARWIDAIGANHPVLSRQDIVWIFSYFSGLIFSRQLINHQYDMFLADTEEEPDVERVTGDIVAFGCAGVEAILRRRVPGPEVT